MRASQNLKNTVAATLFDEIVEHYASHASLAENAYLKERMGVVSEKKDLFLASIKSAKPKTTRESEDKSRAFYFQNLYASLKGYSSLLIESKKEAAAYFLEIINRHGGKKVTSLPYDEETSTLLSIEKEFSSEEAKAKFKEVEGCEELAEKLFAANHAMKSLSIKNEKSTAEQKAELSSTNLKKEVLTYLNEQIFSYLAWAKNSEGGELAIFANEAEIAVNKANASISKRQKKSASAQTAKVQDAQKSENAAN